MLAFPILFPNYPRIEPNRREPKLLTLFQALKYMLNMVINHADQGYSHFNGSLIGYRRFPLAQRIFNMRFSK